MGSPAHFDDVSSGHTKPLFSLNLCMCSLLRFFELFSPYKVNCVFVNHRNLILKADYLEGIQVYLAYQTLVYHMHSDILTLSLFGNIGSKRSSPDYDDEDYDGDPFASKKVVLNTFTSV